MATTGYFTRDTFHFLDELKAHNNKEWFEANRERYEKSARQPMLRFISDLGPRLGKLAPKVQADPRPVGGSMLRIFRDVRFSKDKTPYKTNLAAHFGHEDGTDEATPAFYLHIAPGDCVAGAGIWHPAPAALAKIRDAIVAHSGDWKKVTSRNDFGSACGMMGESLARAPKGYDPNHPFVEDLKRKDFGMRLELTEKQVCSPEFLDTYVAACRSMLPFVKFLAKAVELPI